LFQFLEKNIRRNIIIHVYIISIELFTILNIETILNNSIIPRIMKLILHVICIIEVHVSGIIGDKHDHEKFKHMDYMYSVTVEPMGSA
jgi:hypothetical protein